MSIKTIHIEVTEPCVCITCHRVFEGMTTACDCIVDAFKDDVISLEQWHEMCKSEAKETDDVDQKG